MQEQKRERSIIDEIAKIWNQREQKLQLKCVRYLYKMNEATDDIVSERSYETTKLEEEKNRFRAEEDETRKRIKAEDSHDQEKKENTVQQNMNERWFRMHTSNSNDKTSSKKLRKYRGSYEKNRA